MRRRALGNVPSSIELDHGDILVMDGLAQSDSLGNAAHSASCPITKAICCFCPRVCKVWPSWVGSGDSVLLLLVLAFLLVGCVWIGKWRRCCHSSWRPSHPVLRSLHEVLLAGLGEGVGDCRDAVVTQDDALFGSLVGVSGRENMFVFLSFFLVCKLLDIQVTAREPAVCHHDVCSERAKPTTTCSPYVRHGFLVGKRTLFFFWGLVVLMLLIGRARHPCPGRDKGGAWLSFSRVRQSWLTNGDMALDSGAQFLAVAEHWSIPCFGACMPRSDLRWSCWGGVIWPFWCLLQCSFSDHPRVKGILSVG